MRLLCLLAVLALAGCGSTAKPKPVSAPAEAPGSAMRRLVQYELAGELAASYAMLVREQRATVDHHLYVHCPPGLPRTDVRVLVLGVKDEEFDVPELGKVTTKAVRYEMSIPDADGKRMRVASTGHLIAQDGHWRWTLSPTSYSALLAGACP